MSSTLRLDEHQHNFFNFFLGELGVKKAVQEVREITVKAFNSRDQLIGKCEFGYKPTLLEPKYCVILPRRRLHDTEKGKKKAWASKSDFTHEATHEILENDTVGHSEEGEDVGDKVVLLQGKGMLPVAEVLREVDHLHSP
ncbi:hypothetical protein HPP92_024430 [Vanilla planifolia]|uniref:Uncharacterized protein n=1 Tax=Vanilla planifolia TaxID=51239 RepID=A0A835PV51_VANPL|nr:hypothetical protein HPP92_024430 [Vanilla planifolia]